MVSSPPPQPRTLNRVIPAPTEAPESTESGYPALTRGMTRVVDRNTRITERETRVLAPAPLSAPQIVNNTVVNSEPTVHITIGRVDVRAIALPQPVQPRPAEKPPRPQLTLDEYLRTRGAR